MDTYQLTMRNNSINDIFMTRLNRCSKQKVVSKRKEIILNECSTLESFRTSETPKRTESTRSPHVNQLGFHLTCNLCMYEDLKLFAYFSVLLSKVISVPSLHATKVQMLTMTREASCPKLLRCILWLLQLQS